MKLFWAIVLVFLIAAGFVVFARSKGDAPQQAATEPEVTGDTADTADALETYDSPLFAPEPDEPQPQEPAQPQQESDPGNEMAEDDAARELAEDLLASSQQPRGGGGEDWPTGAGGGAGGDHEHQPIQTATNPWAKEGELPLGDERLAASRLQHSIVEQEDGSLLLDDSFVIRGEGTSASPYEISWDLLMSAAETYQPRLGMEEIPPRVALLDGKYVRISGHLMFPMLTGQADELLVMLNMWDGCCIGTMPSPYDAVEVQLGAPAAVSNQQYFNYGTIEGTLTIDPYLINDWLIGLYLMQDAKLELGM